MNILYIHGFGEKYDPNGHKETVLSSLGKVFGRTIDYTTSPIENIDIINNLIIDNNINIIVGFSLGGWMASHTSVQHNIPFVAINPAVDPSTALKEGIGKEGILFNGVYYTLENTNVDKYEIFNFSGRGLILLDENDELFNYKSTVSILEDYYTIVTFKEGSHKFEHIEESIPEISKFVGGIKCL